MCKIMKTLTYIVTTIDGDYAVLKDKNDNENAVALALLPEGIKVGSTLLWENFEYSLIK